MIPENYSFLLGVISWVLATLFSIAKIALTNLSGGTVRKLEEAGVSFVSRLEQIRKDRLGVYMRLRMMISILLIFAFICYHSWDANLPESHSNFMRYLPLIVSGVGYFVSVELIGTHLRGVIAGRYLVVIISILNLLSLPLYPVILLVRFWHYTVWKWWDSQVEEEKKITAEDEILSLVESEGSRDKGGEIEDDERRMIRGVFDLDETLVHEIMTPRVDIDAVPESATLAEVKQKILSSGHSRIPAYKDSIDHIVGIFYAKDLLDEERLAVVNDLSELHHSPVLIPESKNVGDLLEEFKQEKNHFAVVVDEYGGTAGIVTFEDVLEEIVGDIQDEYDEGEQNPFMEQVSKSEVSVDGRFSIYDLFDMFDLDVPDEVDCDTIGGYVTTLAGHIPRADEAFEDENFHFKIIEADSRKILRVFVTFKKEVNSDEES